MATHTLNKTRNTPWEITKSGDTWIVGDKGRIIGDDQFGIYNSSALNSATIRIDGVIDIESQNTCAGVYLQTLRGKITVGADARVSANTTALYYAYPDGTATIENDGLLNGQYGIMSNAGQDKTDIRNDGRIHATLIGIQSAGVGGEIVNSGLVRGYGGILVSKGSNDIGELEAENATHIVNTGKIDGSAGSIGVVDVAVNIRNKGVLNGDVLMAAGDDALNNRGGTINGDVYGDDGNDVFNMVGGKLNGVIYGGMGDDVVTLSSPATVYVEYAGEGTDTVRINGSYQLGGNIDNLTLLGKGNHAGIGNSLGNVLKGNKGDNALYGQGGADALDGGKGNDRLFGGDAADLFVFKPGYGRDTIMDFDNTEDLIILPGFANFTDFDDLDIKTSGDDVVITFGGGDRLIILDTGISQLSDSNVGFSFP